jgi:hypothetical protein
MPRAAFSMKSLSELRSMTLTELDRYISTLHTRIQWLRGPALKSTNKLLEVAKREREAKAAS